MFHAVFERQARRTFELVNQHDYDSILASATPDIHHRFSGDHALAGDRHDAGWDLGALPWRSRCVAQGEGVFAARSFQVGETVMVGVIEAELDHNHAHASQLSEKRFVLHGGLIAKVNHSCEPNCGIHLNASGAHNFVARQPITAGQEIAFDYAMRNYTVEHFAAHCQCGSPRSRDRITGWKDLPSERKADYRGFVAPYLTDIDNQDATERAGHLVRIEPGSPHQTGQILNVAGVVTG